MQDAIPRRRPDVPAAVFDVVPSRLGFGCASLGSRVGARAGLRALTRAHEAGITWFDVAPVYGAGDAETILAQFLKGRRDGVVVTTKVGLAPPARLPAIKMMYTLGRPLVGMAGGLRRTFRRAAVTRNRSLPLDGVLIERSIAASLRRLGTDRVDVVTLHDPSPEDVTRDDVLRALERMIERGQTRNVGVAGEAAACAAAASRGAPYALLQMSTATRRTLDDIGPSFFRVLHSVFGVGGEREHLVAMLKTDPVKLRKLAENGYEGTPTAVAAALLTDAAIATDPAGVVLLSMFRDDHLAAALERVRTSNAAAPELLRRTLV